MHDQSNYTIFRDCLSNPIIQKLLLNPVKKSVPRRAKGRKNSAAKADNAETSSDANDQLAADDCVDFVDVVILTIFSPWHSRMTLHHAKQLLYQYIATEVFASLPADLQALSYSETQKDSRLAEKYADPIDPTVLEPIYSALPLSVSDSLEAYGLLSDPSHPTSIPTLLDPILNAYISSATSQPPVWSKTRASACEICDREWINLSYHHLIPKSVHTKVLTRGWHEEWGLNSVAWLCGACHRFVHRCASNEELAKDWFTVERLMQREDVRTWAEWVGRIRWKAR